MKLNSMIKHVALYATLGVSMTLTFNSCDEEVLASLTTDDTVLALKEALTIGAKTASQNLGQNGGYLNDAAVRIGVPEEYKTFFELANTDAGKTFLSAIGAEVFDEDKFVSLINQAAETAAPEAAEIFAGAITDMTISDGENILFGANNAATQYLQDKTYDKLTVSFGSVVTNTFDQVSVSGFTLNDAWSKISTGYNKVASYKTSEKYSSAVMLALKLGLSAAGKSDIYEKIDAIQPVNTNLGEYVTGKALDGLFLKVADKEAGIRANAAERTSDLLQKVFGRLDK